MTISSFGSLTKKWNLRSEKKPSSAETNERLAMTLPSDSTDFETEILGAVEQVTVESSEGVGPVGIKDLQGEKTDSVNIPKE